MYNIITGNSTDNRINLLKNFYFMILSDFPALIDAGLRYFHYGHAAIGLNVRLAMLGCETAEFPDYEWNGMERGDTEFLVWQATISGCGELEYEGRLVPVPPGTAMWVRIPGENCYRVERKTGNWKFIFAILRGHNCIRIFDEISNTPAQVGPELASEAVLQAVKPFFSCPDDDPYRLSALSYEFLMALVRAAIPDPDLKNRIPAPLRAAQSFVMRNFDRGIGVAEMAEAAHWGYAHFCREFHRVLGVAPGAYLNRLRLEKAACLLQGTGLSVAEVSERCGFSAPSYFIRAFSRRFGISPGVFRRRPRS